MTTKPAAESDRQVSGKPKPKFYEVRPNPRDHFRSQVTTGKRLFSPKDVNSHSEPYRRFRDLLMNFTDDRGGPDKLSEGQRQLIRRAAALAITCEGLEADMVRGTPVDLNLYGSLSERFRRIIEALGIEKVTPPPKTLAEIIAESK